MARENVELVRRGYDAWNKGDRQWVLDHMSPEVEWIAPPDDPDPGTYRGHEGVLRFWEQWRSAVGQLKFEEIEAIEVGDHVVITAQRSGVGEHSGLAVSDTVIQVFTFDGDKVPDDAQTILDDLAGKVKGLDKGVYLEIEGHTDNIGSEDYNEHLGELRAEAVRNYLAEKAGIPLHVMNVISFGETKPVAANNTAEGRAKNRRVVVRVLE